MDNQQSTIVFPKASPIPSFKALTFYRSGTFAVDVQYADVSELKAPAKISTYTIGPFQSTKGERAKLKVKVRLSLHGIISVESAALLEEEEVEVPVVKKSAKEPTKMETDEAAVDPAPSSTTETDVNMQDAKGSADVSGSENGVPDLRDKPSRMETDAKEEAQKKKVKKTSVPLSELVHGGMATVDLQKAVEKECEMALQDHVMEETKDKKNAVEAYVYDMRNKLNDKYHEFVTDSEKEQFIDKLQHVEDWLYEDGEDETKGVYIAKLEELQEQGDPIEERYKEHMERGSVINQLVYCINSFERVCGSQGLVERENAASGFTSKICNPVLLSEDIRKKTEVLDRSCRPIMTKPILLKPTTPETPMPAPSQGGDSQSQGAENPNSSPNQNSIATETTGSGNEVPSSAIEPMETDKCESAPGAA
ncbi:heat shock 70 kDa 15-like [Olea europaea subsp. europaea]|uniref:Heat shock 70 kDa 15-like n=1 Tax=Olea europaea subsp. europaea TaxID=158383 RepID=A0A8S0RLN5_OLEEU|nr:heat shock 70 kDa 15-like [Olea europaea subsp. europaea]